MPLTLRAVSLNDQQITQPITARFELAGGTIGRADSNTLALPDPQRRISRRQAEISIAGAVYIIKNVGTANPIIVRDQSLAQGESAPLKHKDQVRIGGYLLEVTDESAAIDDRTAVDPAHPFADPFASLLPLPKPTVRATAHGSPAFPASSPFADLAGPLSPANPFAELLGDKADTPSLRGSGGSTPAPGRLPDDFDPFATPPAAPPASAQPMSTSGANAFEDLIPSAASASIDALFGLPSGSARDPLAAFLANTTAGHEGDRGGDVAAPLSTDPLALFGLDKDAPRRAPPGEISPDRTPEVRAAFTPPKPMPPVQARPRLGPKPADVPTQRAGPAAMAPPPAAVALPAAAPSSGSKGEETTVPPAVGWSPEALEVWNALCEGAGVRLDPPPNTGPAFMRVVGMMLRASVEGTVQLMAMRQATRQELQAQVTVIRPRNNNPLKFAPDGQSALEQLLQPAVRGFLPGPAAMTDAMNDLLGHAIGTMAGTRAALEGVLKRFGPQELEAKLTDNSMLDSVLPMNRKAKLWELYLQHYESIRDEAQEDFHTLFGRAFLAAYEQQLERLRRAKSAAPK